MTTLQGKRISGGMSLGKAYVLCPQSGLSKKNGGIRSTDEAERINLAVSAVSGKLSERADQTDNNPAKEIIEFHRMMLEDEDILNSLQESVESGLKAEEAVALTEQRFCDMLIASGDEYMAARADDVRSVCAHLMAELSGNPLPDFPDEPFVLIANDLLPAQLIRFSEGKMVGAVLKSGSYSSHTAILLREMGIPALICESLHEVSGGSFKISGGNSDMSKYNPGASGEKLIISDDMTIIVDGDNGAAVFDPDENTLDEFKRALSLRCKSSGSASAAKPLLPLYVNIKNAEEAAGLLVGEKCAGVGLFRTEYLYLGRDDLPDEEEQFSAYASVVRAAKGKPVIVRTFDLGADKQAAALPLSPEANPALGCRGLRVYSLYPEALQVQLRALLRAAALGSLSIMYPMVTSCGEIRELRRQVAIAAETLSARGAEYRVPSQGAMIETPAAVMVADELAAEVDFFSVGTNDLAQYTYALDRQGGTSAFTAGDDNAALLRMIKIAADSARKAGISIGICGEIAADPDMAEKLADLGLDYFSVSPSAL